MVIKMKVWDNLIHRKYMKVTKLQKIYWMRMNFLANWKRPNPHNLKMQSQDKEAHKRKFRVSIKMTNTCRALFLSKNWKLIRKVNSNLRRAMGFITNRLN